MSLGGWHSDKEERRRWRAASGRSGRKRWEGGLVTPKRVDNSGLGMRKGSDQKGVSCPKIVNNGKQVSNYWSSQFKFHSEEGTQTAVMMSPDQAKHKGAGVDGPPLAYEGDISMVRLGGDGQYLIEACPAPLKQHHRAPPTVSIIRERALSCQECSRTQFLRCSHTQGREAG